MAHSAKEKKKQELERAQFENFLHLSDQSFDRLEIGKPPEPDILAWRGSEQFGIEITSFHRRDAKQEESEQTGVIERASAIYEESGAPNVAVRVMWAPHYRIRKARRETLAREIAVLVQMDVPPLGQWAELGWPKFSRELMLALAHVSLDRLIDYEANIWTLAGGGFVPNWDVPTLQAEIDRKNPKAKKYLSLYAETWLLIISAFGVPSAWMEMTREVRAHKFQSKFTKVFLLSSFPLEAIHLRC
jgi:hypothetical protein